MDRQIFLHILFTWTITSVDSLVISVRLGSAAVLPCNLSHALKPSTFIQWRTDYNVVLERGRRGSYQGDRYKGRADVSARQLLKGNCSLLLKDVWINDAGVYYSYLFHKHNERSTAHFIQRVELEVYEVSGPNVFLQFLSFSLIAGFLHLLYYWVKKRLMKDSLKHTKGGAVV